MMDWSTVIGWVVSLGTAVYLVHYKGQVSKRQADEEKRFAKCEVRIDEQDKRLNMLEKKDAANDVEKQEMRNLLEHIARRFDKLDEKLDRVLYRRQLGDNDA